MTKEYITGGPDISELMHRRRVAGLAAHRPAIDAKTSTSAKFIQNHYPEEQPTPYLGIIGVSADMQDAGKETTETRSPTRGEKISQFLSDAASFVGSVGKVFGLGEK